MGLTKKLILVIVILFILYRLPLTGTSPEEMIEKAKEIDRTSKDKLELAKNVYDFLKKHKGKWFTSKDVSHQTGLSIGSVLLSLKRLRETHFVDFKHHDTPPNTGTTPYIYRMK